MVSQYYYPEQFRVNDLCETWANEGKDVTVLTGIPNYPQGKFFNGYSFFKKRREIVNGVKIIRIPIIPRGKSSIMLALNYFSFIFSGLFWKLFHQDDYDSIFVYEVSPMTQALPAIWYGKKKKIPVSIFVMDLWPENFEIVTGIHNKHVINILNKMVNYIYRNSQYIFTASKSFKVNIESRGISSDKIFFWPQYAEEFYQPSEKRSGKIPQSDDLNITFAGNIGFAQGLNLLPTVAKRIKEKGYQLKFNIVGNGRYKQEMMKEVEKMKVNNFFNFVSPVPAKEIPAILAASDFSLVSLAENEIFEMTIPAKVQSSMACGAPILLFANGEVQEIIKEANCGLIALAGDVDSLETKILEAIHLSKSEIEYFGLNARKYFEENYEKRLLLKEIDQFL